MTELDSRKRRPVKILGQSRPSLSRSGMNLFARNGGSVDYRTYEIYQRERVHESTEKIRPVELVSEEFVRDPYPVLGVLRENYPCYRDWLGNAYWITRYDQVTSVFVDDANQQDAVALGCVDEDQVSLRQFAPLDLPALALELVLVVLMSACHRIVDGQARRRRSISCGRGDMQTGATDRCPELASSDL